ncbi:MAG: DUF5329 family protein [Nannocystaceae bacterium]|nr:DUF5329 family protein [bacterium]
MQSLSTAWRAAAIACVLLAGCPSSDGEVHVSEEPARSARHGDGERLSEVDKIRALVEAVRESGLQFVQDGETHDSEAAANELERRLARTPGGVVTATQFIDSIGAGLARSKSPDLVRLSDGTMLPVSDWLLKRLSEMEGAVYVARKDADAGNDAGGGTVPVRTREVGILDALAIVERSQHTFVAPPRKTPRGKVKGKRKEYTGPEFSEMLRKKWELLGKDINDLDTFIEEIASDAFVSMTPYLVVYRDGREEPFRGWLEAQLETRRQALSKGGAP